MTRAMAVDSRRLALDLHELLRDTDPVCWRDELEAAARQRLESIERQLGELLETSRDDQLRPQWAEVARLIHDNAPAENAPVESRREAWMRLRAQLNPAYERLASALRTASLHVPSVRPSNYRRNLFHVAAAAVIVLLVEYALQTKALMVGAAAAAAAAAWALELGRRYSAGFNRLLMRLFGPVAHPHEHHQINSATWYATSLVALAALFQPVVAVVALVVLGVGDPAAALVGRRWGRVRLVHGRSLEGTLAFFFAGFAASMGALTAWHPQLPADVALGMAGGGAVAGAVAELLARRIDDNLVVPLAAALAASFAAWGLA